MTRLRLGYEDSCRRLHGNYLASGIIPPMPDHLPQYDDSEPLGVSFFRTFVGEGDDLSNLTLPRTFFGRSEINGAKFRNTDFTESNLCWNDFIDVDFSGALLTRCDMRSSAFNRVRFTNADLSGADLRRSSFNDCDFSGAVMEGTVLTEKQGTDLDWSATQYTQIKWARSDGPEPGGG
jgi:uncharacterized protein YjbI with pentapeptide repeats